MEQQIQVREQTQQNLRCSWCLDNIQDSVVTCQCCGAVVHKDCAAEAGFCPTLGCRTEFSKKILGRKNKNKGQSQSGPRAPRLGPLVVRRSYMPWALLRARASLRLPMPKAEAESMLANPDLRFLSQGTEAVHFRRNRSFPQGYSPYNHDASAVPMQGVLDLELRQLNTDSAAANFQTENQNQDHDRDQSQTHSQLTMTMRMPMWYSVLMILFFGMLTLALMMPPSSENGSPYPILSAVILSLFSFFHFRNYFMTQANAALRVEHRRLKKLIKVRHEKTLTNSQSSNKQCSEADNKTYSDEKCEQHDMSKASSKTDNIANTDDVVVAGVFSENNEQFA